MTFSLPPPPSHKGRGKNILRLGVNIDHVATIRNARGGMHPDPVQAAALAVKAGADGITAHLREDRRHISDADIMCLKKKITVPLNLEMAMTEEMLKIALRTGPHAACIVPEKRQEITTEGGLDVVSLQSKVKSYVKKLQKAGIRVSLFIAPSKPQVKAAKACGADIVEFHTGQYCEAKGKAQQAELKKLKVAVEYAYGLGLECHAGHGLSFDTVGAVAAMPELKDLNIGHFIIGEAIFLGLEKTIRTMRALMDEARKQ